LLFVQCFAIVLQNGKKGGTVTYGFRLHSADVSSWLHPVTEMTLPDVAPATIKVNSQTYPWIFNNFMFSSYLSEKRRNIEMHPCSAAIHLAC
jgi:hypothetical protein